MWQGSLWLATAKHIFFFFYIYDSIDAGHGDTDV